MYDIGYENLLNKNEKTTKTTHILYMSLINFCMK